MVPCVKVIGVINDQQCITDDKYCITCECSLSNACYPSNGLVGTTHENT